MKMKFLFLFVWSLFASSATIYSQEYYRFYSEISVKNKEANGKGALLLAKVYYDKNISKIVQEVSFPEPKTIVMTDSASYEIKNFKAVKTSSIDRRLGIMKSTVYHLILTNDLSSYGLEKTGYKKTKVEKEKNTIFTTWEPPKKAKNVLGKIVIGTQNKKIIAALFFDKDDNLLSKQIFRKYTTVDGLNVPTEIYQVFYDENGKEKSYSLVTFKNIKINEKGNDNIYDYPLYFN